MEGLVKEGEQEGNGGVNKGGIVKGECVRDRFSKKEGIVKEANDFPTGPSSPLTPHPSPPPERGAKRGSASREDLPGLIQEKV